MRPVAVSTMDAIRKSAAYLQTDTMETGTGRIEDRIQCQVKVNEDRIDIVSTSDRNRSASDRRPGRPRRNAIDIVKR